MLYDPKWEQQIETKADPFELGTLIAWLDLQPPNEAYDYGCNGHCLLAQYYTSQGFKNVGVGGFGHWRHGETRRHSASQELRPSREGFWQIASGHPRTFGAALKRARAIIAND